MIKSTALSCAVALALFFSAAPAFSCAAFNTGGNPSPSLTQSQLVQEVKQLLTQFERQITPSLMGEIHRSMARRISKAESEGPSTEAEVRANFSALKNLLLRALALRPDLQNLRPEQFPIFLGRRPFAALNSLWQNMAIDIIVHLVGRDAHFNAWHEKLHAIVERTLNRNPIAGDIAVALGRLPTAAETRQIFTAVTRFQDDRGSDGIRPALPGNLTPLHQQEIMDVLETDGISDADLLLLSDSVVFDGRPVWTDIAANRKFGEVLHYDHQAAVEIANVFINAKFPPTADGTIFAGLFERLTDQKMIDEHSIARMVGVRTPLGVRQVWPDVAEALRLAMNLHAYYMNWEAMIVHGGASTKRNLRNLSLQTRTRLTNDALGSDHFGSVLVATADDTKSAGDAEKQVLKILNSPIIGSSLKRVLTSYILLTTQLNFSHHQDFAPFVATLARLVKPS